MFFVSCSSSECLCKNKCGRRIYYVDEKYVDDFFERKLCKGNKSDVMFLSMLECKENTMAKKKVKSN